MKAYIDEALTLLHIKGEWQKNYFVCDKDLLPKKINKLIEMVGSLLNPTITTMNSKLCIEFEEEWFD